MPALHLMNKGPDDNRIDHRCDLSFRASKDERIRRYAKQRRDETESGVKAGAQSGEGSPNRQEEEAETRRRERGEVSIEAEGQRGRGAEGHRSVTAYLL